MTTKLVRHAGITANSADKEFSQYCRMHTKSISLVGTHSRRNLLTFLWPMLASSRMALSTLLHAVELLAGVSTALLLANPVGFHETNLLFPTIAIHLLLVSVTATHFILHREANYCRWVDKHFWRIR